MKAHTINTDQYYATKIVIHTYKFLYDLIIDDERKEFKLVVNLIQILSDKLYRNFCIQYTYNHSDSPQEVLFIIPSGKL